MGWISLNCILLYADTENGQFHERNKEPQQEMSGYTGSKRTSFGQAKSIYF
jgi:hypothetical protein